MNMKIKVRREAAKCTNCGKINEFYYLSDFSYGERLVLFHNGMSYAYINLLKDDVYNDFIDKVKSILNLHQKEFEADVMSIMFCQHYGLEITDERKSHLSGHYKDWKKSDPNNFHPDKSMRKMFDLFREHSTVLDQKIVKAFPELATKLLPQELEVNSEKKKVVNKTAKRKPKKKKTPRL